VELEFANERRERERERERQRQRERQRERETERQRDTERDRETERQRAQYDCRSYYWLRYLGFQLLVCKDVRGCEGVFEYTDDVIPAPPQRNGCGYATVI
jgi:hypothetical protein